MQGKAELNKWPETQLKEHLKVNLHKHFTIRFHFLKVSDFPADNVLASSSGSVL